MTPPSGHDLSGLIKWCARDDWRDRINAVMAEHFEPAMKEFGLDFDGFDAALGGGWTMTLWGCAFEDFLTRRFGPDSENPVEAYLRRRGWKEGAATRSYMAALQTSVMSLYEVSAIMPGQSLRARDLIRGGEPVLVHEHSATQTLKPWERIAARIVSHNGRSVLGGGVLAFTHEGSQRLFAELRENGSTRKHRRPPSGQTSALEGWTGTDDELQRFAALFTSAWLFDVLSRALRTEPPKIFNSDGDEVVFHTVNFPMTAAATVAAIARKLQGIDQLHQENRVFWNWVIHRSPKARNITDLQDSQQPAIRWNVTLEDGSIVLGNIEIKGRTIVLSTSSASRAERGSAMLSAALAGLVSAPAITTETVEQMKATHRSDAPTTVPPIPAELQTRLVHEMLDRQYRDLLGEPLPMLDNRSPRAAARSANGRKSLAVWLKHLENHSKHAQAPDDPMATYDFTWLWRELNIEHLRK